jgi:cephalosporin-C deacetylase-like acetyl esterase/lysophospholipase L1-like esterase
MGEPAGWTITATGWPASGSYSYTVSKNNLEVLKTGAFDLASGPAKIEVTLREPAMLYVRVEQAAARPISLGAAISPWQLKPSVPRPADFDSFWESKLKSLAEVPIHVSLTPAPTNVQGVELNAVKLDCLGSYVQGYLAKPAREGKFPAVVIYQYAGIYALRPSTVTTRAAEGWLAFDVDSHDMPPAESAGAPKDYQAVGNADRETSYFLNMYLRDARAIDYIASRPDWDGKTIVVMGTSMGGQQSLVTAALRPDKVTAVLVNEPSGADSNGDLHGRKSGYPNWPSNDPRIMNTALYFDTVNFAPRIQAPTLAALGFIDTTAPPVGIWMAINQIAGPKEVIPMIESDHNNRTPEKQGAWEARSQEVMSLLRMTGQFHPREQSLQSSGQSTAPRNARVPADQPTPRTDANSMTAHAQLLEKAKQGRTDVYFEGDSITRRWGATDYPQLLANWKENFFGWNAADFGWGADRIENILWRLNNGELDGVNPKVIVLLAGTNNIGTVVPAGGETAMVEDITRGIKAVLQVFQTKAPNATIILMGIFPRNDAMSALPVILRINRNLAGLADGVKIRYLNINDKLADADGRLFDGMMNADKLHPALKGYQVWADALKPLFTELLGAPAKEDLAPPPTGDPSARR